MAETVKPDSDAFLGYVPDGIRDRLEAEERAAAEAGDHAPVANLAR